MKNLLCDCPREKRHGFEFVSGQFVSGQGHVMVLKILISRQGRSGGRGGGSMKSLLCGFPRGNVMVLKISISGQGRGGSMKNFPCDFPREKRNGFEKLFLARAAEIV